MGIPPEFFSKSSSRRMPKTFPPSPSPLWVNCISDPVVGDSGSQEISHQISVSSLPPINIRGEVGEVLPGSECASVKTLGWMRLTIGICPFPEMEMTMVPFQTSARQANPHLFAAQIRCCQVTKTKGTLVCHAARCKGCPPKVPFPNSEIAVNFPISWVKVGLS